MVRSTHVGFRLHPIKDKDILDDLQKYKSATDRWKEVYRLVLAYQALPKVEYVPPQVVQVVAQPQPAPQPAYVEPEPEPTPQPIQEELPKKDYAMAPIYQSKPEEPLNWSSIPASPSVPPSSEKAKIKANILNTDF